MSVSRTEALGQLLMVGLSEERWTSTLERHLLSIKPGGILFSPRQLRKPDSTAELLKNAARTLPAACFLALEEAGGPGPPLVGKSMTELWREDLVPYRELLQQLPLVTVGHGAYKAYDFDVPQPAALSENVVEGLLRIKVCFSRVAVADDLDTPEISHSVDIGEAAVPSVNAGCDLLLTGVREKSAEE